ncbi:hypothetical protein ACIQU6_19705 [Streptomyces sp. NPDC090442]|uniref:non-homologous end-joining DNA ligase LigD n=1 Tax=Streptomyces sp. NPDC090442 TaxID=3365962 RepID=UPI0038216010
MSAVEGLRAGGRTVEIGRPEKVLFPEDGITKAEPAGYYRTVARRMPPQLRGRPLMWERHPDGIDGRGFMQKDVPDYFPGWIGRVELPKESGTTVTYAVCDDTATQTAVAPSAVRARPGTPVAAPVASADVDDPELSPGRWTLARAEQLLKVDAWRGGNLRGRSLNPARRRLAGLRK